MSQSNTIEEVDPLFNLNRASMLNQPLETARILEAMPSNTASDILQQQQPYLIAIVLNLLPSGAAYSILITLPDVLAAKVLAMLNTGLAVNLLDRMSESQQNLYLNMMSAVVGNEFRSLLEYPENSVGREMSPNVIAFHRDCVVGEVVSHLKQENINSISHLFLLNDEMKLESLVPIRRLALADNDQVLSSLAEPVKTSVDALDHREEVMKKLETFRLDVLPVVDVDNRLVGVVEGQQLLDVMREDIVTDLQTMVGASKDERALSSSLFAVRKRLPWLQINLLTAFMAAAVVGMFEETIAQFTALAVLLPIAAGQSGNCGAQALAVTMRGLTLREISMKHWFQVMIKELSAGFINGVGIAITCSIGVYWWSKNTGLAVIMALAMIISMTIAGLSGALVPIVLKRAGLDPAQSSSIVLTTVTDIAGFMSFLGIATLFSSWLVSG